MSRTRIRNRCMRAAFCALIVTGVLSAYQASAMQGFQPPISQATSEFTSPCPSPEGLAWDGSHLWVVDGETRLLYRVDPASGEPVRKIKSKAEQPRGVAWDGKNLWVLDQEAGIILCLDPETGKETGYIKVEKPDIESPWYMTGLTWDGRFLWVAINAGWCSTFNRIDPENGRVVESFFPQCNPRGIASDGAHLWTIAYNGEQFPSKLDQRQLSDKAAEMAQSHKFLLNLEVTDPSALTYSDGGLWMVDRAKRRIFQVGARVGVPVETKPGVRR